jgi:hypothetical protein
LCSCDELAAILDEDEIEIKDIIIKNLIEDFFADDRNVVQQQRLVKRKAKYTGPSRSSFYRKQAKRTRGLINQPLIFGASAPLPEVAPPKKRPAHEAATSAVVNDRDTPFANPLPTDPDALPSELKGDDILLSDELQSFFNAVREYRVKVCALQFFILRKNRTESCRRLIHQLRQYITMGGVMTDLNKAKVLHLLPYEDLTKASKDKIFALSEG